MDAAARKAITHLRASAALRGFVEAMVPARIMLWVMFTIEHDTSGVASPALRASAADRRRVLGDMIGAAATSMLVARQVLPALGVLHHVIDVQLGPYAEGPGQKCTSWMAIACHRLACLLVDQGLIAPMEIGSPMAGAMDEALSFVTEDDLALYDRYATKAAAKALTGMQDPRTYGLYRQAFDATSHRSARIVAAVNSARTRVVAS